MKTCNDHVYSFWNICRVGVPVVFFVYSGCLFAPFVIEHFLVLCSSGEKHVNSEGVQFVSLLYLFICLSSKLTTCISFPTEAAGLIRLLPL